MKSYFVVSFLAFFATLSSLFVPAVALPTTNATTTPAVAELEERNPAIGIAAAVVEAAASVGNWILESIEDDKKKRSEFTQKFVQEMSNKNPHFNYVICHTKHETRFDGQQGVDWGHSHQEFDIAIGGTIGYEVYAFRSGMFKRHGDGGFLNWAWIGYTDRVEDNGSRLFFVAPP